MVDRRYQGSCERKKAAQKTYINTKDIKEYTEYTEYKRKRKKVKELIKASKEQTWKEFGEKLPRKPETLLWSTNEYEDTKAKHTEEYEE